MTAFNARGGGRVGRATATFPFARLSASPNRLELSILFLGSYRFTPSEVVAVEDAGGIPIWSSGVRIRHNRADVPEAVVFYSLLGPRRILEAIAAQGFEARGAPLPGGHPSGSPIRTVFNVAGLVAWNLLLLGDWFATGSFRPQLGFGTLIAIGSVALGSLVLMASSRAQAIVLKPGRSIREIRGQLGIAAFVASLMFLIMFPLFVGGVVGLASVR